MHKVFAKLCDLPLLQGHPVGITGPFSMLLLAPSCMLDIAASIQLDAD